MLLITIPKFVLGERRKRVYIYYYYYYYYMIYIAPISRIESEVNF